MKTNQLLNRFENENNMIVSINYGECEEKINAGIRVYDDRGVG